MAPPPAGLLLFPRRQLRFSPDVSHRGRRPQPNPRHFTGGNRANRENARSRGLPPPRSPFPPVRILGFKIVANMNDQNLEQRCALRKPDFSFDSAPLRGGFRSLSVEADCLATQFRAPSEFLSAARQTPMGCAAPCRCAASRSRFSGCRDWRCRCRATWRRCRNIAVKYWRACRPAAPRGVCRREVA